jgi:ribosomal protein L37AE/L43A
MFRKICPHCNQPSYSACIEKGSWICAYCGTDITDAPASADLRKTVAGPRSNPDSAISSPTEIQGQRGKDR